jgi:hypothetical protein
MTHSDQPAIQNSTGICFYCNSKLVDVATTESWTVKSGEMFIKVKCSNQECQGMAWKLTQSSNPKENISDGRNSAPKLGSGPADGSATTATRSA